MGLIEQIYLSPDKGFSRLQTTITTGPQGIGSGSTQLMGGSYVLLNASTNTFPCRIRLYNDSASVNIDDSRVENNFDILNDVGLIADIVITSSNTLLFNPPILGFPFKDGDTWYNISSSTGTETTVNLQTYPFVQNGDSLSDRSTITISGTSVSPSGDGATGQITTKKSFVILSGSANVRSRLRLYTSDISFVPATEIARSYGTTPLDDSRLIADFMFDTSSFSYKFGPVLEAYSYTGSRTNTLAHVVGTGKIGYQLQNLTATTTNITTTLYIYTTEE